MSWRIFSSSLLVALTVAVHAFGLAMVVKVWMTSTAETCTKLGSITWQLIRLTWRLILIHLVEISIWGAFYSWQGCFADAESAFYFAGVTYTTVGYGDLVLPRQWRLLGPVEGLTGILMCGLSAGVFFAVVNRLFVSHFEAKQPSRP